MNDKEKRKILRWLSYEMLVLAASVNYMTKKDSKKTKLCLGVYDPLEIAYTSSLLKIRVIDEFFYKKKVVRDWGISFPLRPPGLKKYTGELINTFGTHLKKDRISYGGKNKLELKRAIKYGYQLLKISRDFVYNCGNNGEKEIKPDKIKYLNAFDSNYKEEMEEFLGS